MRALHWNALGAVLIAACGRIDFNASGDALDARAHPCAPATAVPDPLSIAGQTFRYTSFDNTHSPMPNVNVAVYDETNTMIAQTTSDGSGNYTVSVPTGGIARSLRLGYGTTGYLVTSVATGLPFDRDLTGANTKLWEVGDAPLWNPTAMVTIYDTVSLMRDDTMRSTLNVAVRTCAGESIAGVTVLIDPPPEAIGYTTDSGITLTATTLPASHAVAFNARMGITRITATAPGLTFPTITIPIGSGDLNTLTLLQPYE